MTPQEIAAAAARLVRDGVCDAPTALEAVTAEERGRQIAARVNAQRTSPAPKQEEKKP